jgi:hypothetical protein
VQSYLARSFSGNKSWAPVLGYSFEAAEWLGQNPSKMSGSTAQGSGGQQTSPQPLPSLVEHSVSLMTLDLSCSIVTHSNYNFRHWSTLCQNATDCETFCPPVPDNGNRSRSGHRSMRGKNQSKNPELLLRPFAGCAVTWIPTTQHSAVCSCGRHPQAEFHLPPVGFVGLFTTRRRRWCRLSRRTVRYMPLLNLSRHGINLF